MIRRLFRYSFSFLSAASLVLCAVTVLMWLRSYSAVDSFHFAPRDFETPLGVTQMQCSVSSAAGGFRILREEADEGRALPRGLVTTRPAGIKVLSLEPTLPTDRAWQFAGVGYFRRLYHHQQVANGSYLFWGFHYVSVPYWMLSAVTAILAAAWVGQLVRRRRRARRRRRLGLCLACGYDLRATPGRCPECGTPTPAAR